jgi:hypothetical protein
MNKSYINDNSTRGHFKPFKVIKLKNSVDSVKLCKSLLRLENKAHKIALYFLKTITAILIIDAVRKTFYFK